MCGIAGVLYKQAGDHEIGKTLIEMLDGCQHRGPDSTGFALYGEDQDLLQLRFIVPTDANARQDAIDGIATLLERHDVPIVEGPVPRPAADGEVGRSVYFRDPDGNLLELLSTV